RGSHASGNSADHTTHIDHSFCRAKWCLSIATTQDYSILSSCFQYFFAKKTELFKETTDRKKKRNSRSFGGWIRWRGGSFLSNFQKDIVLSFFLFYNN
ncbi:MAG: hypothetical protein IJC85_02340, partial [Oscillospiraceae bacterium]|nr:hypothetical protein [Oscillospiraceae bacterium]